MKLAICIAGTKSYLYAWEQCVKAVITAAIHVDNVEFIFSTDTSEEAVEAADFVKNNIPENWKFHIIRHDMDDTSTHYEKDAQMRIAILQGDAFQLARKLKVDYCWSVESDILVDPQALQMSEWVLNMPGNYYDVCMITYFNGAFLGGYGDYQNPIFEDFLPHERILKPRLKLSYEINQKRIKNIEEEVKKNPPKNQQEYDIFAKKIDKEKRREDRLKKRIKICSQDGTIWEIIAKYGWRERGWFDHVWPALKCPGTGCLETKWVGLGCTFLSQKALQYANFNGYNGGGTQDLFEGNEKWRPKGLKFAVVPHVLCDHIKPKRDEKNNIIPGEYIHYVAYHEKIGPHEGHLRVRAKPWEPL